VKKKPVASGKLLIFVALAAAPFLIGFAAGCGDFWRPPTGTSSSTGSTASTTTLTASTMTPTVGATVTFTATVSPAAATGTVTFYNGTSSIGAGTLASGTATASTAFTTAGTFSMTADYSGDSTYAASVSSAVSVNVSASASNRLTRITLDASDTMLRTEDTVTLTATVSPADATGSVTFYDAADSPTLSVPLGTAVLNAGTATLSVAFRTPGTHQILAIYGGSNDFADSSTLSALNIRVNQ
jgi:uncharacterized protein YjdB